MHKDRVKTIYQKNENKSGKYILYWMQQSMRIHYNHALNYAINLANEKKLPLIVLFNVVPNYPDANLRHYTFMLEGIVEVKDELDKNNIQFDVSFGHITHSIEPYLKDCGTLIMDRGYLKIQKQMRNDVYKLIKSKNYQTDIIQIESDLLIPVESLYPKSAYGAYVIRPKAMQKMNEYMDYTNTPKLLNQTKVYVKPSIDLTNIPKFLSKLDIDQSVKPYYKFVGGYKEAIKQLDHFLDHYLKDYNKRSDPALHIQSYMSMYLQFGQISDQDILTRLYKHRAYHIETDASNQFIEQLIVRRSLAYNFVTYNKDYDQFEHMSEDWAYKTMDEHEQDIRTHLYSLKQIEESQTHDIYFNAAMKEARITGFMANYLRMYWAKKIMEWSTTMKDAYYIIVYLNNKYFLDGRNPNSYSNIAWNFGKHDRAWQDRAIFGKLRYMNQQGLIKKFDMDGYLEYINELE